MISKTKICKEFKRPFDQLISKIRLLKNDGISSDTVINAYMVILGRKPESEAVIQRNRRFQSIYKLITHLLDSKEFKEKFHRNWGRFPENTWVCKEVLEDRLIFLDLHDEFVSKGAFYNDYEPSETKFLKENLKPGDTFIDIGSNIGWFTLIASKIVYPSGQIFSFEPRKETFHYLNKTLAINNLEHFAKCFNLALSNSSGLAEICQKRAVNPGHTFLNFESNSSGHIQKIKTEKLDSFLNKDFQKVDFIKIDVEGAEYLVFEGSKNIIKKFKPIILSELNPSQLNKLSKLSVKDYINYMRGYGYSCYQLDDGNITRQLYDWPKDIQTDVINVVFK